MIKDIINLVPLRFSHFLGLWPRPSVNGIGGVMIMESLGNEERLNGDKKGKDGKDRLIIPPKPGKEVFGSFGSSNQQQPF